MEKVKGYRVDQVRCKHCGFTIQHGEGTANPWRWSPLSSEEDVLRCTCGRTELHPYAPSAKRILFDGQTATVDDVEDLSVEWLAGYHPKPYRRFILRDRYFSEWNRVQLCCRGAAPWKGMCVQCKGEIPEGLDFVRIGNEVSGQWMHPACADRYVALHGESVEDLDD